MKIAVLTHGSRGDVEPYLAIAVGLQQRGHRVTVVAPSKYAEWIKSYGVDIHPLAFDSSEFHLNKPRPPSIVSLGQYWRYQSARRRTFLAGLQSNFDDYYAASQDADLIFQTGFAPGGMEIAEVLGLPLVFAHAFPTEPTRAFPSFALARRFSFGIYNWLSVSLIHYMVWSGFKRMRNRLRTRLGLPPLTSYAHMQRVRHDLGAPTLYAYSQNVLPRPQDWHPSYRVPGYWPLPAAQTWEAPAELTAFLADGPAPVFVGFGSMPGAGAERRTQVVVRALELSGQRGVILVGGGRALARVAAPSSVIFIDGAPFAWLFQHMAAVVHHGGAGTTAAALRAGVPTVVAPVAYDQFAWAKIIDDLGAGLRAKPLEKLEAGTLAALISRAVDDGALRARAAVLGARLRAEDGIAAAIDIVERYADGFAAKRQKTPARPMRLAATAD